MDDAKKLGRYEVIREIGRGGMSTVFLAHDPVFERDVALKLLPREFLHDPSFKARFEREAKAIARLEHAAIVPVYDFGEEEGQPFLVMRYMTGGSLGERLRSNPLSIDEVESITSRLGSALDEAHGFGMIHRDIKPGNVLFDHHGDAFLTDFGIVKLTQETATYTGSGIVGTPAYMSPEQARGDPDIDARSDVYALGAIIFEMLTGRPPYISETVMGLAIKHITEPVPSILAVSPDLPEGLEDVIQKAMCKDREGRYNTAGELAQAFEDCIAEEAEVEPAHPEFLAATIVEEPEIEATHDEEVTLEEAADIPQVPQAPPSEVVSGRRLRVPVWAWGAAGILIIGLILLVLLPNSGLFTPPPDHTPTSTSTAQPTKVPTSTPEPIPTLPPIVGPDPSTRVAAFYYPW
ncbi:MAG: protein kinase [Anaerolineales bacterium]|nr:protein kinase [Anaerolineales bacterium]